MILLKEIDRETYGQDARAINRHSERSYEDEAGNRYVLSCTLDGCPLFFEAYGPFKKDHEGILPRLKVLGQESWGDGWTWRKALRAFCKELTARIVRQSERRKAAVNR